MSILHTPIRLPGRLLRAALAVARESGRVVEGGWCQGSYAKDVKGVPTAVGDEGAQCFCSEGAMMRAGINLRRGADPDYLALTDTERATVYIAVERTLAKVIGVEDMQIPTWNDKPHRVQGDVVNAFQSTAKRFEEGEATDRLVQSVVLPAAVLDESTGG